MSTINISLPEKLKKQADALVAEGYYASFSDLIRTALRKIISADKYDLMAKQAMDEYRKDNATVLRSPRDVDTYVDSIISKAKK